MADIAYIPDGNNQANNILPWMLAAGNGGFGGFGGFGGGLATGGIGFLLGLLFGNGWNGLGGFGGGFGGGNGAGFLSNQIDNNAGRELLMNAINSNGEASRAAVQNLATMTGQDFNLLNSDVESLKSSLSNLALQQAVSVPQIINSIQSGNASLMSKLCDCCCSMKQLVTSQGYENQIATLNQTNTLAGTISGGNQRIVDAIADLKATTISEFCAARERDMQADINTKADIITQLRGQLDNDRQTAQLQAVIAPLQAQVNSIASKQINTVPVAWPNLQAVNTTPYVNGGYYGSPFGFGNGVNF